MEHCREALVESLGIHLEGEYNLPPLAARIYAALVLTGEEGLTFDELRTCMGASKGAVSTSLNLLRKMGNITYHTKPGDRKRYFKIAGRETFFLSKLEEYLKKIQGDREMILRVYDFNKSRDPIAYEASAQRTEIYLDYLEKHESLLRAGIEELKELV